VNKTVSVENIPGMEGWGERRRMVEGVSSSMKILIYYKNFCKCQNVPPASTTINKISNRNTPLSHGSKNQASAD
jgi:hypothetical protein